jgi:lycopene cyclase domain-containing protein
VDFFSVLVPLLCSFEKRICFWGKRKAIFAAIGFTAMLFLIWDAIFTHFGIWGFNERYILGYSVFGLPIEEVLFFISIPYSCLFSYVVLNYFLGNASPWAMHRLFFPIAGLLMLIGLANYWRWYTLFAFVGAGAFLLLNRKIKFMPNFLRAYIVTLFPFVVVNGILTGAITAEPVVWYNNAENLALRFGTIPIEDFFYGLLMNGLVVWCYHYFEQAETADV